LKRTLPIWTTKKFPFGVYESFEEIARRLYPKMKFAANFDECIQILQEVEGDANEQLKYPAGKLPKLMPVSETSGN
jgi:hypothetical protein